MRLPSPWDAMGMKHICSKSSLHMGFELKPGITILLTETARIKQNRAENAKPSQFSRVFSEVPGSLQREKPHPGKRGPVRDRPRRDRDPAGHSARNYYIFGGRRAVLFGR